MSNNKKIHLVMTGGHLKAVYLTPEGLRGVDGTYHKVSEGAWVGWLIVYSNKDRPDVLCHHMLHSPSLPALKRKIRRYVTNLVYNKDSNLG